MSSVPKFRWHDWVVMSAIWVLAGAWVVVHAWIGQQYVRLLDEQGRRQEARTALPLGQVIPARYADAQMWVRHALDATEAGELRVRFTTVDNAPVGREVHWSSGFMWLLRGGAIGTGVASGVTEAGPALERTLLWFNGALFFVIIVGWSGWAARRAGTAAGMFLTCAFLGHQRFREVFEAGYVDHHGGVNAALVGLVLGACFMGFGWHGTAAEGSSSLLPKNLGKARRAALVSGVSGAVALWCSASSTLAVIALVALGGLAAAAWQGRRVPAESIRFAPEIWRLWGRTGALCSAVFYLIEYAPNHLGWRLEVNHPLYSLAWWAGAESVAMLVVAWISRKPGIRPQLAWSRLLPALALVALPPIVIFFGGSAVFLASDPFVSELRHFVAESRSLPAMIKDFGLGAVAYDLASVSILIPAGWLLWRSRTHDHVGLSALVAMNAAFLALAFLVVRWWTVASVLQVTLLLWVVGVVGGRATLSWRPSLAVALALFLLPAALWMGRDLRANHARSAAAVDLFQPLYRDLAVAIRASEPEKPIVLLANPNASAGISYFGRFQSIGTLFWENAAGLRAAAEILCAPSDEEALRLLHARGVTHIALLSASPFVAEYFALLHPDRPAAESTRTFGHRLAADPFAGPSWLQPIPYRSPPELAGIGGEVSLFKFAPDQSEDVHLFHTAVAQAARGQTDAAERSFRRALALVPSTAQASFCGFAGEAAYDHGAHALAVKMLRHGLELRADAGQANLAAWILATSRDSALRDGAAALALVLPLARRNPDDVVIASTLAASYAELGRFDEAAQVTARVLTLLQQAGADAGVRSIQEQRLESYRARRAWRQ